MRGIQGAGGAEGRQDDQDRMEQERRQEKQEEMLGAGKEAEMEGSVFNNGPTKRPVKIHVTTLITVSRPKQTESTPRKTSQTSDQTSGRQTSQTSQQTPGQRISGQTSQGQQPEQDKEALRDSGAAKADGENASSGGCSLVLGPSYIPMVNLLAVVAVAGMVFGEM